MTPHDIHNPFMKVVEVQNFGGHRTERYNPVLLLGRAWKSLLVPPWLDKV